MAFGHGRKFQYTPIQILGSKYLAYETGKKNEIAIGCERHTITIWKRDYKKINSRHGESETHANEVLSLVEAIVFILNTRKST